MQGVLWTNQPGTVNNGLTQRNRNYRPVELGTRFWQSQYYWNGIVQPPGKSYWSGNPSERTGLSVELITTPVFFAEYNGAYNGSEKIPPKRIDLHSLIPVPWAGWFLKKNSRKSLTFLDITLKGESFRWNRDDNIQRRWIYMTSGFMADSRH